MLNIINTLLTRALYTQLGLKVHKVIVEAVNTAIYVLIYYYTVEMPVCEEVTDHIYSYLRWPTSTRRTGSSLTVVAGDSPGSTLLY